MNGKWICFYVNDYSDVLQFTINGTNYNGTCYYLAMTYGATMQLGISANGDLALMVFVPDTVTTPLSAMWTDSITMIQKQIWSVDCEFVGGHPKPPNR